MYLLPSVCWLSAIRNTKAIHACNTKYSAIFISEHLGDTQHCKSFCSPSGPSCHIRSDSQTTGLDLDNRCALELYEKEGFEQYEYSL